ncbi:hypothetical protein BJ165DRAFT_304560 [Panaeolus papilionaceus]|nr:hypothetical protein BJ165DRAFT_304560 [Panaeolus papilionaceus]
MRRRCLVGFWMLRRPHFEKGNILTCATWKQRPVAPGHWQQSGHALVHFSTTISTQKLLRAAFLRNVEEWQIQEDDQLEHGLERTGVSASTVSLPFTVGSPERINTVQDSVRRDDIGPHTVPASQPASSWDNADNRTVAYKKRPIQRVPMTGLGTGTDNII